MSPERWRLIAEILAEALQHTGEERERVLRQRCASDAALRREVERYLEVELTAARAFDHPLFSVLETPDDLPRGAVVDGRYKIARKINQGGMGEVYLAHRVDGVTTQELALKVIRAGRHTAEIARRFQHEREILAALGHRHIARFFDGGTVADGRPYFVMEFVIGRRIDDYCRGERPDLAQRIELLLKVCTAIAHAHRRGVIHCDLKPSNILVTDLGEPKLVDFGIAKLLNGGVPRPKLEPASSQRLRRAPMTPEYASPEQWDGRPASTLSDVYSLGVILYEMVTGRRLFQTSSIAELEQAVQSQRPVRPSDAVCSAACERSARRWPWPFSPLSRARRALRGDVDAIVLKAVARSPWQRYKSAEALAEDLGRFLTGLPVAARGKRWLYRARKLAMVHRWGVGLTSAMLAAILVFGTALMGHRVESERQLLVKGNRERAWEVPQFLLDGTSYGCSTASDCPPHPQRLDAARELLDQGGRLASGLRWDLPRDLPAAYATLGQAYLGSGRLAEARTAFEQASQLRAVGQLELDAGWVIALFQWARTERGLGQSKTAGRLLATAENFAASEQVDSPRLAKFLNNEALRLMAAGELDLAVRFSRSSLAMRRRLGASAPSISLGEHNLAILLAQVEHPDGSDRNASARPDEAAGPP
ncbi:MAG: protein kinase [Acidobacteriota bacterium]